MNSTLAKAHGTILLLYFVVIIAMLEYASNLVSFLPGRWRNETKAQVPEHVWSRNFCLCCVKEYIFLIGQLWDWAPGRREHIEEGNSVRRLEKQYKFEKMCWPQNWNHFHLGHLEHFSFSTRNSQRKNHQCEPHTLFFPSHTSTYL